MNEWTQSLKNVILSLPKEGGVRDYLLVLTL